MSLGAKLSQTMLETLIKGFLISDPFPRNGIRYAEEGRWVSTENGLLIPK
jgi:hypothetical protein